MNDLLSQVTPHTCGIIWLVNGVITPKDTHYTSLDYLLNGLLTATINSSEIKTSQVIIGNNFGKEIYVLVIKDLKPSEVGSYFTLIKPRLNDEADLLVLDDAENLAELQKATPKDVTKKFRLI